MRHSIKGKKENSESEFDNIEYVARKMATLTKISSELDEDLMINIERTTTDGNSSD